MTNNDDLTQPNCRKIPMIPGAGGLRKTNVRYAATARMQQPKMIQVIIRKKKKKRKRKTRSCNVKRRPPVHSPKALETKRKKRHYLLLPASMAHVPTRKSRAKTLSLQLQVRNCRVKQLSIHSTEPQETMSPFFAQQPRPSSKKDDQE